jgi:hypothetical protein
MRHGRFIATVLAAAATMAVGPTMASAATSSLVDDSVADFSLGTPGNATTVVPPGSVNLNLATLTEPFDGPGLPGDVTTKQWSPPDGSATVASGALVVQGALFRENRAYDPGQVMEFTATFSGESFQHVGFAANDFVGDVPYAIVSDNSSPTISARTYAPGGVESTTDLGVTAGTPHTFRIQWSATEVKYYVDGAANPAATHAIAIAGPMNPVVSDANAADGSGLSVDSLGLQAFESRPLDAGDPHAAWGSLSATVTGTGVAFETRSGNGTAWSAWQPVGVGGVIQSPAARYIQYRSLLSAASPATVERVQIDYTDDSAPDATIDGVQVVGTTAGFAFSSPAADVAGFQCAADGGPFTSCASPTELTSLAPGAHTMAVRAIDRLGNVGQAVSRSLTIDGPPATSSSSTSGTTGAAAASTAKAADTTAPRITVVVPSARASKRGTIGVRVGCPATEASCTITVALERGRTTVGHKTVTVRGGTTVKVTLQLTKAAQRQLTRDRRLKLSAVITARDAAGNRSSSTKRLTLRA